MGLKFNRLVMAIACMVGSIQTAYTGQVATACLVPDTANTSTAKWFNSRSPHFARDTITSLRVAFPNWYVNASKVETNCGGTVTLTGSIEYPAGTFTAITWAASSSVTTADGGQDLSDAVTVAIPKNAQFWIRCYGVAGAGSTPFSQQNALDTGNGGAFEFSATSLTDKTMSGTITNTGGNTGAYTPLLIVSNTVVPSVFILGDSRQRGALEAFDSSGDRGEVTRSVGPTMGYINCGISGDTVVQFNASYAKRMALSLYCSHATCGYGINDLAVSTPPATIAANLVVVAARFTGKPIYMNTVVLTSSSGNGWIDAGGQTVGATNAARVTLNGLIRAGIAGATAYIEVADQVETARDSGIWKFPGYTSDGVHETLSGSLLIKNSGVVPVGSMTYYNWLGGILADADVNGWRNRVYAAGGSISPSEASYTTTLVASAKANGYWSALARVNLMIGDFTASIIPLVNTLGGTTDGVFGMTAANYSRTTGFTTAAASGHYIDTGAIINQAAGGVSAYLRTAQPSNATAYCLIGGSSATDLYRICANRNAAGSAASGTVSGLFGGTANAPTKASGGMAAGFWRIARRSSTDAELTFNGASVGTSSVSTTPGAATFSVVLGGQKTTGPAVIANVATGTSMAGYVIDNGLTLAQDAMLYAAMQALNTSMGRQV